MASELNGIYKNMVCSLRQVQEKCCEHHVPLFIAFIDTTTSFYLVSKDVVPKIACPPELRTGGRVDPSTRIGQCSTTTAHRSHWKSAAALNKAASFLQRLFGIFCALRLKRAFNTTKGTRTRSYGTLFNLVRLRAKPRVRKILIRDMLFADDAACSCDPHSRDTSVTAWSA